MKINEWKKVACVLYSEWHEKKKSLTKWLYKKTMKHWKSSAKMDLTKKLPFSSTFLEVYLVLGKKQGKYLTNFSKLITETTESQSGNIWKDQWCLAEVVYIYAFSTMWVFPPFYHFFSLNYADIAKDPIIWKIIQFEQIPKPPEGSNYMSSTV